MSNWRRSEPETIRPFFEVRSLEKALDEAVIIPRPGDEPQSGPVIAVEEYEWDEIVPILKPAIDRQTLVAGLGGHVDAFELALLVRDPTFKRRAIVARWPVGQDLPDQVTVERECLNTYGHNREIQLTLAVCLARYLPETPGLPSLPGSWLCQKTFELRRAREQSQFPIEELTEQHAKSFGISLHALIYVDYIGHLNEVDDLGSPVACAYVNADIYRRLTSGAKSEALLALLESEIVARVILAASEDILGTEEADIEHDAPLERILRQLANGEPPITFDELRRMLRDERAYQLIHAAVSAATGAPLILSKV